MKTLGNFCKDRCKGEEVFSTFRSLIILSIVIKKKFILKSHKIKRGGKVKILMSFNKYLFKLTKCNIFTSNNLKKIGYSKTKKGISTVPIYFMMSSVLMDIEHNQLISSLEHNACVIGESGRVISFLASGKVS